MPEKHRIALYEKLAEAEQNLALAQASLAHAERIVERAKDAIAEWEGAHPDTARRRRHLRILTIPIAIGAAMELVRRSAHARRVVAATVSALAVGGAIFYAVGQSQHPRPHAVPPTIPAPATTSRPPRPDPHEPQPTASKAPTDPVPPAGIESPTDPTGDPTPAPSAPPPTTISSTPTPTPSSPAPTPDVETRRRCVNVEPVHLLDVRASIRLLDHSVLCVRPLLR